MPAKQYVTVNREKYKGQKIALCNSAKCTPRLGFKSNRGHKVDYFKFTIKDVKPGTVDCPHCGYVLLWKRF